MAVKKGKKTPLTAGANATIDQYFKVKKESTSTPTNKTRNVDENFNSQPVDDDDMKLLLLSPERKSEKITKQTKRTPLAEIRTTDSKHATFSMALSSKKKPSKPAFVVLRDEDIDNGVTEAQQPPSNDTTTSIATSQQLQQQHDSFWTQSVPIGNTLNSQSSITSSPVHVDDTQDHFLKLLDKETSIQNEGENDNGEEGIRIDKLLDSDDEDGEEEGDDPFFDDLDDPFITKTNNKRRIPYASPYSNKRQCPFSVASTPGLHHGRKIKGKSLFDENENDDDDDDDDDLLPPDSMLFISNNNNNNNNSTTSSSPTADDQENVFPSECNNTDNNDDDNDDNDNDNFISTTRTDSLTTDDQIKSDTYSTSEPASPLNINDNNQDIISPKVITSSPIIEYSISESMTFPIEYHFDDDNDDDNNNNNNNTIKAKEKDNEKEKESDSDNKKNDNNNNNNTNYTPIDNNQYKTINENNYSYYSPPIIQEDEKIRSTVSSPAKSTILLSSPSKSQLKSTLTSPSKSPSSINISQLDTLPLSLPSDTSLDIHVAYPNPRGKSILEKFDLSEK